MRIRTAVAGAAIAVLALAGCSSTSDSDSSAEETMSTTESPAPESAEEPGTIVEVAAGNSEFETLAAAIEAAGLTETLSGDGPFTVFAPTDAAFEALPAGVLDKLLLPANEDVLVKILTYHVVSGEVTSDQIGAGEVPTVEGQTVTVTTKGGVQVNGANVVTADVDASNGVIHVIDAVLIPPDVDPAAL